MGTTDIIAIALVGLILLGAVVFCVRLVAGIGARGKSNRAFLDAALSSCDVAPSGSLAVDARAGAYGVWLDLELSGREPGFDLTLDVRVAGKSLLNGVYPIRFDSEQDARGLPDAAAMALNTTSMSALGADRIKTVLRPFRFDVPSPSRIEVRIQLTPIAGTTLTKSRALLTTPDAPP